MGSTTNIRIRRSARWLVGIAGLIALIASGCGGTSSSDSTANSTAASTAESTVASRSISKAVLIKQGDAICREIDEVQNNNLTAYLEKHPNAQSNKAGEEAGVKTAGLPPIATEITELAALGAPEGEEDEVEEFLKSLESALQGVEAKPSLVIGTDHSPFDVPNRLATRYGFKDCSETQ